MFYCFKLDNGDWLGGMKVINTAAPDTAQQDQRRRRDGQTLTDTYRLFSDVIWQYGATQPNPISLAWPDTSETDVNFIFQYTEHVLQSVCNALLYLVICQLHRTEKKSFTLQSIFDQSSQELRLHRKWIASFWNS